MGGLEGLRVRLREGGGAGGGRGRWMGSGTVPH